MEHKIGQGLSLAATTEQPVHRHVVASHGAFAVHLLTES